MMTPIPAHEPERLAALRALELLDTQPEKAFQDLVHLAAHVCQAPIALIALLDQDRQWLKAKVGIDVVQTPRDAAFCAHTILGSEILMVPDAHADERFTTNPLVTSAPYIRFYAGVPLLTSEGYALGTLSVLDRIPRTLSPEQQELLRILADRVMDRIELRRRVREAKEMAEERTRFIHDITEHKRTEEALTRQAEEGITRALEKTEQVSRFTSEFVASMSHEMRTALNGIIGMTGLLFDAQLSPARRELAEIACTSAESLLVLINDILDFSKIEAGKLTVETMPISADAVAAPTTDFRGPATDCCEIDRQGTGGSGARENAPRLLVVEDNAINQRVVQLMLEKEGHRVVLAANGSEALRLVEQADYDLILMDCQMPEMDGYEATQRIRALEEGKRHTPIIAVTASTMQGDRKKCLEAGMDDFLAKPILRNNLQSLLARYLPRVDPPSAPAEPKRSVEPPFDLSALVDRIGDAPGLLREFARLFGDESSRLLAACREAIQRRDGVALSRAAYDLRGILMNLDSGSDAGQAIALARLLEQRGQAEGMSGAAHLLTIIETRVTRLAAYLHASIPPTQTPQ